RRRRRKSGTAVGLAATLTIGAVLMTQPIPPLTPEALAGDAEILKSDPLAVRGEESPRPSFGPQWTLGEDRNLLPVEDVDGFIAQVRPRGGWLRTLPETYSYIHPPAGKLLRLDIVG